MMSEKSKLPHRIQIKIEAVYDTLKSAERRAADYLLAHPETAAQETLREISGKAGSSMATFVRLAKKLGYQGYQDLKEDCGAVYWGKTGGSGQLLEYESIKSRDDSRTVIQKVFQAAIQALEDTRDLNGMGEPFERSVRQLETAGKILVLGAGDAYITAYSACLKFSRIGLNVNCPADYDVQLLEASKLKEGDVLLLISHSGDTRTLYETAQIARERQAFLIIITNYPLSPLAKIADEVLLTAAFLKNPYNETMAKRIPQLCIVEALYISLLQKEDGPYGRCLEQANRELERNKR
ncbi:MurR/RpiR family transcriptional regulator [Lachnospiraceae bacterium KGMB03038]|nr:MurR/RpiR family transcriptional regulator [Lachnospiraceae bacterium KGMB03038]